MPSFKLMEKIFQEYFQMFLKRVVTFTTTF